MTLFAQMVAVLALWLTPGTLHAQAPKDASIAPECHAATGSDVSFEQMADRTRWICDNSDWRADQPSAWLWFDRSAWESGELPRHFFTRIARHQSISFAALDDDGTMRSVRYLEKDGQPLAAGPVFQLALPEITTSTRAVLMRVDLPHSLPLLTEARLIHQVEYANWSQLEMMLLALVIGMLILPLAFDLSYFVVLRERSVLVHAAMVASMIAYVFFAGGLISVIATLPVAFISVAGALTWALGCGISALFLADFLEKDAQSPFMRRVTLATGIWTIVMPGFFSLQLHPTQAFDDQLYFFTFIPALVVITAAIAEAIWRGSRSARIIALAWMPLILAGTERFLRGVGAYTGPSSLDQLIYIAIGIEVVIMSLAIADRFFALRRERDAARTEARMLEQLSERDPLTGLMNRRAVETRFATLRAEGFDTFALVDLDRFKSVNDRYGHQIGDRALIACAEALRGGDGRDTIAIRLGGEEFVVLMRGKRTIERLEALRQMVAMRISTEIVAIDFPVTASMGVIELPSASKELMNLDEMYARADALLYQAKESGRDRMCFERLKLFNKAPKSRPKPGPVSELAA
ncbi:diguanylate cyclase [uncultured Erythrobacter sp.]|uniref:sensor domain-containing diguanylate cyclase n=1 Tax=uncultured Erythrobacter sp. TaxID=263913 RepID=UPI0026345994|nr:diguanylate cyclase [uncultured Erythrobacter sp.]